MFVLTFVFQAALTALLLIISPVGALFGIHRVSPWCALVCFVAFATFAAVFELFKYVLSKNILHIPHFKIFKKQNEDDTAPKTDLQDETDSETDNKSQITDETVLEDVVENPEKLQEDGSQEYVFDGTSFKLVENKENEDLQ